MNIKFVMCVGVVVLVSWTMGSCVTLSELTKLHNKISTSITTDQDYAAAIKAATEGMETNRDDRMNLIIALDIFRKLVEKEHKAAYQAATEAATKGMAERNVSVIANALTLFRELVE